VWKNFTPGDRGGRSDQRETGGRGETIDLEEDLLVGLLVVAIALHEIRPRHTDLSLLAKRDLELWRVR
jgi:DNA-binding NtrC family response regulator